jgi:hypothetical protein
VGKEPYCTIMQFATDMTARNKVNSTTCAAGL